MHHRLSVATQKATRRLCLWRRLPLRPTRFLRSLVETGGSPSKDAGVERIEEENGHSLVGVVAQLVVPDCVAVGTRQTERRRRVISPARPELSIKPTNIVRLSVSGNKKRLVVSCKSLSPYSAPCTAGRRPARTAGSVPNRTPVRTRICSPYRRHVRSRSSAALRRFRSLRVAAPGGHTSTISGQCGTY